MTSVQKSLLLNPEKYNPDSFDLVADPEARAYWIDAIVKLVEKFVEKSECLNPNDPTAKSRAQNCLKQYKEIVEKISLDSQLCAELSIRRLLEINEECLQENGFQDSWLLRKTSENTSALAYLPDRLSVIDAFEDKKARWLHLIQGIVAGNFFDWGSKQITDILQSDRDFTFENAINKIEPRPWLVDQFDSFYDSLMAQKYKCVLCFPDNSGFDIILGVLPVVREFLKSGTKVILSANSRPSINDVTHHELVQIVDTAATKCTILANAVKENRLICIESGSGSPCLDFRKINQGICKYLNEIDLVMIEGMGRAIHTNYFVKFAVDSLKLAVIKNEWVSSYFGGQKFSVICKYETAV